MAEQHVSVKWLVALAMVVIVIFGGCFDFKFFFFSHPMPFSGETITYLPDELEGVFRVPDTSFLVSIEERTEGEISIVSFRELAPSSIPPNPDTISILSLRDHEHIFGLESGVDFQKTKGIGVYHYGGKIYTRYGGILEISGNRLVEKSHENWSIGDCLLKKNNLDEYYLSQYIGSSEIEDAIGEFMISSFKKEGNTLSIKTIYMPSASLLEKMVRFEEVDTLPVSGNFVTTKNFSDKRFYEIFKDKESDINVYQFTQIDDYSSLVLKSSKSLRAEPSFPLNWEGLYVQNDTLVSVDIRDNNSLSVARFVDIEREILNESIEYAKWKDRVWKRSSIEVKDLVDHASIQKQTSKRNKPHFIKYYGRYYLLVDHPDNNILSLKKGRSKFLGKQGDMVLNWSNSGEFMLYFTPTESVYSYPFKVSEVTNGIELKQAVGKDQFFRKEYNFDDRVREIRTGMYLAELNKEELDGVFENENFTETVLLARVPKYSIIIILIKLGALILGFFIIRALFSSNTRFRRRVVEHHEQSQSMASFKASRYGLNQFFFLFLTLFVVTAVFAFVIYFPNLKEYVFHESLIDLVKNK